MESVQARDEAVAAIAQGRDEGATHNTESPAGSPQYSGSSHVLQLASLFTLQLASSFGFGHSGFYWQQSRAPGFTVSASGIDRNHRNTDPCSNKIVINKKKTLHGDVTFGHFRIRPFGRCRVGGQKCIAVIERKALIVSLFTNASDRLLQRNYHICKIQAHRPFRASLIGVVTGVT